MLKNKSMLFLGFLPLLAGCAGYKSQPLSKLHTVPLAKHKDIAFGAKAFNADECQTYLGRNVINAGYTPIQITINNDSKKKLQFSCDQINMPLIATNIVAESVYQSYWGRALGYGIPGAALSVFGGILTLGGIGALIALSADVWLISIVVAAGLIVAGGVASLTAGIVDAGLANVANNQLFADYCNKALKNQIIMPRMSIDGLVFVKNDQLEKQLVVNLIDNVTHEKIVCQASL